MAIQIALFPALIIATIIIVALVYWKTKSWAKVGYSLEIIIALVIFVLSIQLPKATSADRLLMSLIDLLGLGLLINGLVSILKK